ncbi:MAG: MBL fold metallo-hydrolase [Alphaproteobacteria bacterium]|nr:MBL fold metallo-hydrolase [Alphaproteobacteria bacterium]
MKPLPDTIDVSVRPPVIPFFDPPTNTISYIVKDPASNACAIVDSVLDIDYPAGRITQRSADAIIARVKADGLTLEWIIETHVHADHLSAARYIRSKLGGRIGISEKITVVQETFGRIFNEGPEFRRDGSQFDYLFKDGDTYEVGRLKAVALHTPGHTPACMTHVFGDAVFVGDTLFMPDGGTARADFPGGDAHVLYRSMRRILSLPKVARVFMCHDYGPNGRPVKWETTIEEENRANIHVHEGVSEDAFVAMRKARDATLDMPRLILPSLQVNMRAGDLPPPDRDGKVFLKVPVNAI